MARDEMALLDDWSSKDLQVPSTSTVLKNNVFVLGGDYVGTESGLYTTPCVVTPQTSKMINNRTVFGILF